MERTINNIQAFLFLAVAVGAALGVIFCGAYWHILTALMGWVMFRAMYIPKEQENGSDKQHPAD